MITKRILLALLSLVFSLALSAQAVPGRKALPKLTFDNPVLQECADRAAAQYNLESDINIYEQIPERWHGNDWELLMLNYFIAVDAISDVEEGSDEKPFSPNEAEQVQSAMLDKYFAGCKIQLPKKNPARFEAVEHHVMDLLEKLSLLDGSQMEINTHVNIQYMLNQYLSVRFARELRELPGLSTDMRAALLDEEDAFRKYADALVANNMYTLWSAVGGFMYFSMLPMEVNAFGCNVEEYRVRSLKLLSPKVGGARYEVEDSRVRPSEETPVQFEKAFKDYVQLLDDIEGEEENKETCLQALIDLVTKFNEFAPKRDAISALLPESEQDDFTWDSLGYMQLFIDGGYYEDADDEDEEEEVVDEVEEDEEAVG